jgi:hypothetical protein
MKKQWILISALILGLMAVKLSQAQGPGPEEEMQPQGDLSIEATVSSKFGYQGMLKERGSLVTGNRDMIFRLYSDDACTTQVGGDIPKSGVEVTNGLFSVELDVVSSYFDGQGLWLEVEVGGTSIGCQEILPVPYALSLRPGARIIMDQSGTSALTAMNGNPGVIPLTKRALTGYTTDGAGVYGVASSGTGVYGEAAATSGTTCGVHGQSASPYGDGVYGHATSASGSATGVRGQSDSAGGFGVLGYASDDGGVNYGVHGISDSSAGYGGYFYNGGDDGVALYAQGSGATRDKATLRVNNTESSGGMAAYLTNNSNYATVHLDNDGSGQVLWLTNGGTDAVGTDGGDFIHARNSPENSIQFRVASSGDVIQNRQADGLVKAGVFAYCGSGSTIRRSFNNVGGTIAITGTNGSCAIDFGFQISDRYWVVTAGQGSNRMVKCYEVGDDLVCQCWDENGSYANGDIMVLVY